MQYSCWDELKEIKPVVNGNWDIDILYEYLVSSCYKRYKSALDDFFQQYQNDEKLAEALFVFLLDDDYSESESQIGAAYYIARLNKEVLKCKKELLRKAQENPVHWKRPFQDDSYLEWL